MSGCEGKWRDVCKFLKQANSFNDKNEKEFAIRTEVDLNCDSKHIVYLVTCRTCGVQ